MTRRQLREARRLRCRRIRALLASGLVLGVGAAVTLAAWNDSEYGTATFTASQFGIVGSTDAVTFSEHSTTEDAAALSFQVTTPTAMVPGQTTYALFSVKTIGPSIAGTAQLVAGTPSGGLAGYLRYGVRTISGTTCNLASYSAGTVVVADESTLSTGASGTQSLPAEGAGTVNYCFAVTLLASTDNTAQGQTMSQTWQILGTSS